MLILIKDCNSSAINTFLWQSLAEYDEFWVDYVMLININIGKPFSLLNIRILQMNTAVNICTQEHKIISITDNIILLAVSICFVQGEALIVKGRAGYWQMS